MKAWMLRTLSQTTMLFATVGMMSGCLLVEDQGTTETVGTSVTAPPDFTVSDGNPTTPSTGGDNTTQSPPASTTSPADIEEGFLIDDGAAKTSASTLDLQLITLNRNQMKISTDASCAGGVWEPWQSRATIRTPVLNGLNLITVQYKDWDGMITRCYRQTIVHDGRGPDILFTRYPNASLEEGATADLAVSVSDAAGSVSSVTCRLNNLEKPCLAGRNEVSITQLPVGDYEFAVHAVDDLGNVSDASVRWTVVSLSRHLTQSIRVNNYKKVDILIVIDNSGSMEYEQRSMGGRTGNLLSVIAGLDWQIAVTTTDPRDIALGDGRFIPISGAGGATLLTTATPTATAQQRLSATLQRPETGSGDEQGIRAAYRAVERYKSNDANARAFFRDGAQFAVLVISDEDESANTTKNDPQSLIQLVHDSFGGQKSFGFHSIITKPGDTQCRSTYGYSYGDRYNMLSQMTGGVVGSVCATDYASQVSGIAQGIRDLLKSMTLQCAPLLDKGIHVKLAGVEISDTFRVDGVNLKFDSELQPGDYTVEYSCLNN